MFVSQLTFWEKQALYDSRIAIANKRKTATHF